MATGYERIERMVPHKATAFIVAGAVKIKAIVSSFDDRQRMKWLLRKTAEHGSKIARGAAKPYFSRWLIYASIEERGL
jgi:hypothetical protein